MKVVSILVCMILVLCIVSTSYSVIDIEDQDDFEDAIDAGFTEQVGAPDYIIHANGDNDYTVPLGEIMEIDEGVVIQIEDGFEIFVIGRMTTGVGGANPIVFERVDEGGAGQGDNWEAITIVGNAIGGLADNDGVVTLDHVEFRGGGAGAAPGEDEADWRGMVRLTGNFPVLVLGTEGGPEESNFSASETSGIIVHGEVTDFDLTLYNVDMDDDEDDRIQDIGIKINDYRTDPENGQPPQPREIHGGTMLIDAGCNVQNCGAHGLASYRFADVHYSILNSNFSDNGTNNPNPDEDNGAGLYFWEGPVYELDYTIDIINTSAESNSWDGMRFKNMSGLVHVTDCSINDNSERGIFYDLTGWSQLGFIEECVITGNDWDGVFVQKGAGQEAGIKIRYNQIRDNSVDVTDYQVGIPLRQQSVANIRLHGHLGDAPVWDEEVDPTDHTEIWNNILEGANNGITLESLYDDVVEQENRDSAPEFIDCCNNVQFGAAYHGLWIQDLATYDDAPDPAPSFYNNVFSDNGDHVPANEPDGDSEVGIRFGPEKADGGLPELANDVFHSNIIVNNDDFGILYEEDNNPDFTSNGYNLNGDDLEGCTDAAGVFADPVFVGNGDYHLQWSSPMINQGAGENDNDGSLNDIGAFGGAGAIKFTFEDWEDYIAILTGSHLEDNGDHGLEFDTYWMFGDCDVEEGETLTIDDGATVYMSLDASLTVDEAQLLIEGIGWDPGQRVLFRAMDDLEGEQYIQDNPHGGILIDGGIQDSNHRIQYCEIWGSDDYALSVTGDAVFEAEMFQNNHFHHSYGGLLVSSSTVDIEDSEFDHTEEYGVRLSNNLLDVSILRCNVHDNWKRGIRAYNGFNELIDTEILRSGWQGVYLSSCNGIPSIQGSESSFNEKYDGQPNYANHGFYLSNTDAAFDESANGRCIIEGNRSAGLACYYGSTPSLSNTTLTENGREDEDPNTSYIAEISLSTSSFIDLRHGDEDADNVIEDERQGDHYVLIHRPSLSMGQIDGTGSDWSANGNGEETEKWEVCWPTNEWAPELRLLTAETIEGVILVDDVEEERIPWRYLYVAIELENESEHIEALRAFTNVIESYPESPAARVALSWIMRCWLNAGRSLNRLNDFINDLDVPEDATALQDDIFFKAQHNLAAIGEYDDAVAACRNRAANARCLTDSLRATFNMEEIRLAQMFEERSGNIDAFGSISAQEKRLEELMEIAEFADMQPEIEIEQNKRTIPANFEILSAYPNPFNGEVSVVYSIPINSEVSIKIFDMNGREVAVLHEGLKAAGYHRKVWQASDLPSGQYLCRIHAQDQTRVIKLNLVK